MKPDEPEKNRFQFAEEEGDEPRSTTWAYDEEAPGRGTTVFLEESAPQRRDGKWFRRFLFSGLVLLLLAALGVGIYFAFIRDGGFDFFKRIAGITGEGKGTDIITPGKTEEIRERFYLPQGNFSRELRAAIALYEENNRHQAKRELENLIAVSPSAEEKAAALTYLGVMALETERYVLARHQLSRALKQKPDYVPALVNLAIAERHVGDLKAAREHAEKAAALAPKDPRISVLLGNLRANELDLPGAEAHYREGLKRTPDDPYLTYNLAVSLAKQQKYEEAILYFNRTIENDKSGRFAVQAYARLGRIYFLSEKYGQAADYLRRAVELAPNNGRNLYNLGVVYLRLKKDKEAARWFKRALEAGSNDADVLRGLAQAFENMKQPSLAISALKKALYLNPDDLATLFQLADLYYEEKELLEAADLLRKIVNITPGDRNTEDALLKLGAVCVELERHQEAVDVIRRALKLNAKNPHGWYSLGIAYRRMGRNDLAVGAWKKALGAGPDSASPPDDTRIPLSRDEERMIRMELASLYRSQGAYDLALKEYGLILAADKRPPVQREDPDVRLEIGRTYLQLRDLASAVPYLKTAVEAGSATPTIRREACLELARAYGESDRPADLELARSYAYRAARMAPDDSTVRLVQASVLLKTDSLTDRERALEILQALTVTDLEPKMASQAYNLQGLAYYKNGEFSRALNSFDYAVQLDPSNRKAYDNQRLAANALERGGESRE